MWRRSAKGLSASTSATFHPSRPLLATAPVAVLNQDWRSDGIIELWSTAGTPTRVRTLHGHMNAVACMDFSSDGRFLATAGDSWRRRHGTPLGESNLTCGSAVPDD
ncbi:hypothetical protein [Streptomyces cylindrosporus]|uniref:hypothetical protein n=1 Tax=Streptomyces cylindrosporus TaxID=2927583 RepID=UPI00355825AA